MAEHTPGPWFLEESDGTIRSRCWGESDQMGDYRGVIVCSFADALGAWPTTARKHAESETRSNARLISAAPELLAACKDVLPVLECAISAGCDDPDTAAHALQHNSRLVQLRAAIAKAEGH